MTREEWLARRRRHAPVPRPASAPAPPSPPRIARRVANRYRVVALSMPPALLAGMDRTARTLCRAGLTQRPNRSLVAQRAIDLMRTETAGMTREQFCAYFADLFRDLNQWLARQRRRA